MRNLFFLSFALLGCQQGKGDEEGAECSYWELSRTAVEDLESFSSDSAQLNFSVEAFLAAVGTHTVPLGCRGGAQCDAEVTLSPAHSCEWIFYDRESEPACSSEQVVECQLTASATACDGTVDESVAYVTLEDFWVTHAPNSTHFTIDLLDGQIGFTFDPMDDGSLGPIEIYLCVHPADGDRCSGNTWDGAWFPGDGHSDDPSGR